MVWWQYILKRCEKAQKQYGAKGIVYLQYLRRELVFQETRCAHSSHLLSSLAHIHTLQIRHTRYNMQVCRQRQKLHAYCSKGLLVATMDKLCFSFFFYFLSLSYECILCLYTRCHAPHVRVRRRASFYNLIYADCVAFISYVALRCAATLLIRYFQKGFIRSRYFQ